MRPIDLRSKSQRSPACFRLLKSVPPRYRTDTQPRAAAPFRSPPVRQPDRSGYLGERFSPAICTNSLRSGHLQKCSTDHRVCLRFLQAPEHQGFGTFHPAEPLISGVSLATRRHRFQWWIIGERALALAAQVAWRREFPLPSPTVLPTPVSAFRLFS